MAQRGNRYLSRAAFSAIIANSVIGATSSNVINNMRRQSRRRRAWLPQRCDLSGEGGVGRGAQRANAGCQTETCLHADLRVPVFMGSSQGLRSVSSGDGFNINHIGVSPQPPSSGGERSYSRSLKVTDCILPKSILMAEEDEKQT